MPLPRILSTKYRGNPSKVDVAFAIAWAKRQIARLEKTIQEKANSLATAGVPIPKGVRQFHYKQLWRETDITLKRDSQQRWTIDLKFAPEDLTLPPIVISTGQGFGAGFVSGRTGQGESALNDRVTGVSLKNDPELETNVVAVAASSLGNNFTFSTNPLITTLTREQLWRNLEDRRLAKVQNKITTFVSKSVMFITPPELVALSGSVYQAVRVTPVYYDRANDKISFTAAGGLFGPGFDTTPKLLDPSAPVSGTPGAHNNLGAARTFFYTAEASSFLQASNFNANTQVTTFNDVPAGTPLQIDWAVTLGVPAGTTPVDDGPFDIDTDIDPPVVIDALSTLRGTVKLVGNNVDGVSSTVVATITPNLFYGGVGFIGTDMTDATLVAGDPRPLIGVDPALVGLDDTPLSRPTKYLSGGGGTVGATQVFGVGGYRFGGDVSAVQAAFPPPQVVIPRSTEGIGASPTIRYLTSMNSYLYEGPSIMFQTKVFNGGVVDVFTGGGPAQPGAAYALIETAFKAWKIFTFNNGVISATNHAFDGETTVQNTREDTFPLPGPFSNVTNVLGGQSISFDDVYGRDTIENLGSGAVRSKTVTLPPPDDPLNHADGWHTLFTGLKEHCLISLSGPFIRASAVGSVDPVSGFKYLGGLGVAGGCDPVADQPRIYDASNALVAHSTDGGSSLLTVGETYGFTGGVFQNGPFFVTDSVQRSSVVPGIVPRVDTGVILDITQHYDGKWFGTPMLEAFGVGVAGSGLISAEMVLWANDIGLDMSDMISVRWIDATTPGVHGLFMAMAPIEYALLRNDWVTLLTQTDPVATDADILAARNLALAELQVIYNNFCSLDYVIATISFPGQHTYIVDKQNGD